MPENRDSDPNSAPAGFWVRFVAHVLDSALLGVAATVLLLMGLGARFWARAYLWPEAGESFDPLDPEALQLAIFGVHVLLAFPYYAWAHYRYGTTLGKLGFRVYVVDRDGRSPINALQSLIRTAGYAISWFFLAGYLMAAFHREKRALHDLLAGTRVIRRPFRPSARPGT